MIGRVPSRIFPMEFMDAVATLLVSCGGCHGCLLLVNQNLLIKKKQNKNNSGESEQTLTFNSVILPSGTSVWAIFLLAGFSNFLFLPLPFLGDLPGITVFFSALFVTTVKGSFLMGVLSVDVGFWVVAVSFSVTAINELDFIGDGVLAMLGEM